MIKKINFKKLMLTAFFIYLTVLALLFIFQRNLQYIPSGYATKTLDGFEEKKLTTADRIKILAWYKAPQDGEKIILYFHGNAGNISGRSARLEKFSQSGFGVLAISYRGYFGSQGKPSEKGLIRDGEAAFKFLLDQGYLPKDIILYGESLGSGVAVQLAARFDVAAVILESPFSSATSVAQGRYWFMPVGLLLKDKFNSIKFAPQISSPTLVLHGTADGVVPFNEGKKLFDLIGSPKRFIEVQGAGHLDFSADFLAQEIGNFLRKKELAKNS